MPVHFLHIRKTGGTAVTEALRPVADSHGLILHDHSTKLRDVPPEDQVVFFVRHPIPRFVSGFYSRLRRGLPRHQYEWNPVEAEAFRNFQNANELAEGLYTSATTTAMLARQAMHGISHIKSSYQDWFSGPQELDDRSDSILLLGLQETLSSDLEELKRILKLPQTVRLPEDDVLAHRTPPEFDRKLSPRAEHNLLKWYAEDIRFYEHCLRFRAARGL